MEGEEEVWINADASGRLVARYQFPTKALERLGKPADLKRALERIDENEKGFQFQTCKFEKVGFNTSLTVEATFENALDLLTIAERNREIITEETSASPDTLDGVAGEIKPTYHRAISISSLFPPDLTPLEKFGLRSALRKAKFKFILHLPAEILETNAHEVSNDRQTAAWIFPLKDHFKTPIEMSIKMSLPVPWWVWVALVLIPLLPILLIWKLKRRKKA